MSSKKVHLWQGQWLSDEELSERLPDLGKNIRAALKQPFEIRFLLKACEKLSNQLGDASSNVYRKLDEMLKDGFEMDEAERKKELAELSKFLTRRDLEEKLASEFGKGDPFNFTRPDYKQDNFERWSPLGFIVHIAPTNAYAAGAWSVLEGLLSGNVNFLKTGGSDEIFAQQFLSFLLEQDESGTLAGRIFACKISSKNQKMLADILANADGVVVWGDEGAISGIRALAPATARFIEWGPKISIAYFAKDSLDDEEAFEGLALECCRMEQQACSSPQIVYAEVADRDALIAFARKLADKLKKISPTIPCKEPAPLEQAEITSVLELCRLESCLGLSDLIEAEDRSWRILIEFSGVMKASPLYRTIWVKPLLREDISNTLSPLRSFLQTAGLACKVSEISELCDAFDQAGVLRITRVGKMLDSYSGEPHDGVFALQRYSRKISVQRSEDVKGIASFADLKQATFVPPHASIMSKADFQGATISATHSELFFKSGGSSGEPKLSIFTYDDYHLQMTAAANGLFAAGLNPKADRCMNLFFAGGLYGGFVSFFTILETLKAVQFPMAGHPDTKMVAETIVAKNCNVLLGMPSYIIQLFSENADFLRKHKTVEKIFYGGEHFNESQKRYFQEEFGVKLIRSGGYGSVDAGPIGYQCVHCTGSVHHLHSRLHIMELLELENDKAVPAGEPGRVVLTSLARAGQKIQRYDIGDMARLLAEPCPCGRKSPRFELLGRHGDVFRIGSAFFNYGKFAQIFTDHFDYAGEMQIILRQSNGSKQEEICIFVSPQGQSDPDHLRKVILENYGDLKEIVVDERLLDVKVHLISTEQFARTTGSGKLKRIIDERAISAKP